VTTLEHIGLGNNFLKRTPVTQQIRERIDKWDSSKENGHWTEETAHRMGENLWQLDI
jgi:hypothetical protein